MSSQYWTTYLYASHSVMQRVIQRVRHQNENRYGHYRLEHLSNTQWLLEYQIETNSDWNDGHQGEMDLSDYQHYVSALDDVKREDAEKQRRIQEEQQRIERMKQKKRDEAQSRIQTALATAKDFLSSQDFEKAERELTQRQKDCQLVTNFKTEVNSLQQKIAQSRIEWMDEKIASFEQMIHAKKWDEAKSLLDKLSSARVSATGKRDQISSLRTNLNSQKKEWEAAERERLRLEKIANEEQALNMATASVKNWSPLLNDAMLQSNSDGFPFFVQALKDNEHWAFLNENQKWMADSNLVQEINNLWRSSIKDFISEKITNYLDNSVSRENLFSDEVLGLGLNSEDLEEVSNLILQGLKDHFSVVAEQMRLFHVTLTRSQMDAYIQMFIGHEAEYIDEQIRIKNRDLAISMVGQQLNLQSEDDFAMLVANAYIGDHIVRYFSTDEHGKRHPMEDPDAAIAIQAGEDIVIVLESCYDTQQQNKKGHLKNEQRT